MFEPDEEKIANEVLRSVAARVGNTPFERIQRGFRHLGGNGLVHCAGCGELTDGRAGVYGWAATAELRKDGELVGFTMIFHCLECGPEAAKAAVIKPEIDFSVPESTASPEWLFANGKL